MQNPAIYHGGEQVSGQEAMGLQLIEMSTACYRKKPTEGFQSTPYLVRLFSCLLWMYYASLKFRSKLLLTINGVGYVIETLYITMYMVYAPKSARLLTAKLFIGLDVGLFGLIALVNMVASAGPLGVQVVGWICVVVALGVFAAPSSIIVTIHLFVYSYLFKVCELEILINPVDAQACDPDQERGVHALLAVLLAGSQRVFITCVTLGSSKLYPTYYNKTEIHTHGFANREMEMDVLPVRRRAMTAGFGTTMGEDDDGDRLGGYADDGDNDDDDDGLGDDNA
ncbi:Bidirectional sugar transporter SWEET15 [Hordeum vulgare]|nr:Bidirectional sugar transporter SWEET15 [Hordeum vulgare]